MSVFFDSLHLTVQDWGQGGEYNWQATGQVRGATVLLVDYTSAAVLPRKKVEGMTMA